MAARIATNNSLSTTGKTAHLSLGNEGNHHKLGQPEQLGPNRCQSCRFKSFDECFVENCTTQQVVKCQTSSTRLVDNWKDNVMIEKHRK